MKTLTRSSLISVLLMGVTLRNGQAQIVTDGSLGTSRMLTGPNYQIPSSLGQVYGPNLFQSFRQFNLSANQSATFSGPVSVVNILSRVTGGQQSHIDGTINSTIPGANLFFVNPSGVVLGPKGAIKVNGSFVVSTADLVRLKDGHVLQAGHPTDAILSSAPPEAFGFLNSSPAAIQINGSALAVNMGRSISLIGGDLQLQQAMLTARRGAINLVSVAAAGQVEWPINTRGSEVNLMTFSQMGNINAHNVIITVADPPPPGSEQIHGSQTNNWLLKSFGEVIKSEVVKGEVDKGVDKGNTGSRISNPAMDSYAADNTPETNPLQTNPLPGGSVVLRGNNLALINSVIFAGNTGTTRGGQIDVGVRGTLRLLQDSTINTRAVGQERGAAIKVVAGGVMLQDYSGLATSGESYGKGGDIIINTKNLVATNGSYIGALSTAQGASGDISITSDRVDLKGQGFSSNIGTATLGDGKGGNINLTGKMVNVSNTDVITTSTSGRGDGGSIFINSDQVTLNGQITPAKFTGTTVTGTPPRGTSPRGTPRTEAGDTTPPAIGVATMTLAPQGGGKGGNINLQSHTLDILNGGQVTATTRGSGTAGDIAVKTAATSLTGGGLIGVSTLASQGGGKSGNINLQSHTLDILNGGLVSADTVNNGNAGTITIDADKVLINGEGSRDFTAITATTLGTGRGGKGGNINLQSHTLDILNGGVLATDTKGSGSAGSIFIKADNIQIDTQGSLNFTGISNGSFSNIGNKSSLNATSLNSTDSSSTGLDATSLNAPRLAFHPPPFSDTHTFSQGHTGHTQTYGNGGSINVEGKNLHIVNGGLIAADTETNGTAGDVILQANHVVLDGQKSKLFTGILARTFAATEGGKGGNIRLEGGTLQVLSGAVMSTNTQGSGRGGAISINAKQVLIDGQEGVPPTGINAVTSSLHNGGQGGDIQIKTSDLNIRNVGEVNTSSYGSGNAGTISIQADHTFIDGQKKISLTGLGALTYGVGRGGNINLQSHILDIDNGGLISASTHGHGAGGNISIQADEILLSGFASAISVLTAASSTGRGGSVILNSGSLQMKNGATISAASLGTGDGGAISVQAIWEVALSGGSTVGTSARQSNGGDISIRAGQTLNLEDAFIGSSAGGNGGNLKLNAGHLIFLRRSQLNAIAGDNGGNIDVDPRFIIFDKSQVRADALRGHGGNITLRGEVFVPSAESIISASSQLGLAGTILIQAPNPNLGNSLVRLPDNPLSAQDYLQELCAFRRTQASTFSIGRQGVIFPTPNRSLPALTIK